MVKDGRLRLLAEDADDLKVVSAMLQDAIVPIGEIGFVQADRRFALVANRFRWETADKPAAPQVGPTPDPEGDDTPPFERVHSALRIEHVDKVAYRGINLRDRGQFLCLLSLEVGEGAVLLHFAGGGCIRLTVSGTRALLEDMGAPWPTTRRPAHPVDDQG